MIFSYRILDQTLSGYFCITRFLFSEGVRIAILTFQQLFAINPNYLHGGSSIIRVIAAQPWSLINQVLLLSLGMLFLMKSPFLSQMDSPNPTRSQGEPVVRIPSTDLAPPSRPPPPATSSLPAERTTVTVAVPTNSHSMVTRSKSGARPHLLSLFDWWPRPFSLSRTLKFPTGLKIFQLIGVSVTLRDELVWCASSKQWTLLVYRLWILLDVVGSLKPSGWFTRIERYKTRFNQMIFMRLCTRRLPSVPFLRSLFLDHGLFENLTLRTPFSIRPPRNRLHATTSCRLAFKTRSEPIMCVSYITSYLWPQTSWFERSFLLPCGLYL